MKTLLTTLIILLIILLSCTHEKDIQVQSHKWKLIKKMEAYRYPSQYFIWLIWQRDDGTLFSEYVPERDENKYYIGMIIVNRDRK